MFIRKVNVFLNATFHTQTDGIHSDEADLNREAIFLSLRVISRLKPDGLKTNHLI